MAIGSFLQLVARMIFKRWDMLRVLANKKTLGDYAEVIAGLGHGECARNESVPMSIGFLISTGSQRAADIHLR